MSHLSPRKQRQVCTSYAPHTFRTPTDIGTSRVSSGIPSDFYAQTSYPPPPPFSEPLVLPRVAPVSRSAPPSPPVVDDTNAHLIGLVPGDKNRLGRVFIEPNRSTWDSASKEVNKAVRESVKRLFSQPCHSWWEIPEDHRQAMFEEFKIY
ncbi:hypothetical protein P3L10_030818 [Capsicum annuum]